MESYGLDEVPEFAHCQQSRDLEFLNIRFLKPHQGSLKNNCDASFRRGLFP